MAPFALVSLGFVAIAIGTLYTLWWGGEKWVIKRGEKEEPERSKSLSSPKKAGPGKWIGLVFGGLFFLVGLALLFDAFLIPVYLILNAGRWAEIPCEIISSHLRVEEDSDGTSYSADIFYKYTFEEKEYKSNQYSFFSNSGSRWGQKEIVDRYSKGDETVCYVDPDDPTAAVLNRSFTWDALLWGLFPLVFVALGGAVFFSLLIGMLKPTSPGDEWMPKRTRATGPGEIDSAHTATPLTEITLKPETSHFGCLLLLFIVGLVCNGIAVGCVWKAVRQWQAESPDYSVIRFAITMAVPLLLIGLACVLLLLKGIRAQLFNPKPVLKVSRDALPLGESFELHWTLKGQVSRVRHLTIQLIGREMATFTVGTSTQTDESDFCTIDIFKGSDPFAMAEGRARVVVPYKTMHSFESDNNKVVWLLKVKGDTGDTNWIPHIAHIDREYRIVVLPLQPPGERV